MSDTIQTASELTKVEGGWLTADRTIPVEADDVEHGVRRDQWGCAIVRAIQKKYPSATRVRVNAKITGFTIGEIRYTYPTPPEAIEGIIKPFDQGKTEQIEPMTLRLRAGKMREVSHSDERARIIKRTDNRARAEQRKKNPSEREALMSPNWHEYERF